jgi:hypothetical protein
MMWLMGRSDCKTKALGDLSDHKSRHVKACLLAHCNQAQVGASARVW